MRTAPACGGGDQLPSTGTACQHTLTVGRGFPYLRLRPAHHLVAPNGGIFEKIIGPVTAAGLDQQIAKAKLQGW